MPRSDNLYALPPNLPVPEDDGACDHLPGLRLPAIPLPSTAGRQVDLSAPSGTTTPISRTSAPPSSASAPRIRTTSAKPSKGSISPSNC